MSYQSKLVSSTGATGCGLVIGVLLVVVALVFLQTWVVMILFGVLASMTGWGCAIGFWPTFVIVWIMSILTSNSSTSSD